MCNCVQDCCILSIIIACSLVSLLTCICTSCTQSAVTTISSVCRFQCLPGCSIFIWCSLPRHSTIACTNSGRYLFVTQRLIATSQTRNAAYYFKMFGCCVICFLCCNVIAGQWISSHACPQYGGTSAPAYISGTPAPLNTVFPLSLLQSKLYY